MCIKAILMGAKKGLIAIKFIRMNKITGEKNPGSVTNAAKIYEHIFLVLCNLLPG